MSSFEGNPLNKHVIFRNPVTTRWAWKSLSRVTHAIWCMVVLTWRASPRAYSQRRWERQPVQYSLDSNNSTFLKVRVVWFQDENKADGFPFDTEPELLRPELISFTHLCHIYILNFWPHLAVALIRRRVSRTVKHSEKDLKNRKTSITCWFYPNLPVPFSKEGLKQGSS